MKRFEIALIILFFLAVWMIAHWSEESRERDRAADPVRWQIEQERVVWP